MTTRVKVSGKTVWFIVLNVVAALAVVSLLRRATVVLSWAAVALLLALALTPLVGWLERRRVPRAVGAIGLLLAALSLFGLLVASLLPPLVEQGRSFVEAAPELLAKVRRSDTFRWADEQFRIVERVQGELKRHGGGAALPVLGALAGLLEGAAGLVTIFVLTAFMLIFGRDLERSLLAWIPPGRREHVAALADRIRSRVGGYVAGSLLIAGIGGVVTAVTLLLVGVPYVFPLGLMTAFLGLLPFIGVIVAAALMIVTTLATVGAKAALIVAAAFLVYQQVENHLLQPLIQRKTIDMNPLIIAGAMLIGTAAMGILGAVFALPVAGALKVLLEDRLAERQRRWKEGSEGEGRAQPRETDGRGEARGGLVPAPEARH
jgi:putative heme transporter